jgi:hypothetical protein
VKRQDFVVQKKENNENLFFKYHLKRKFPFLYRPISYNECEKVRIITSVPLLASFILSKVLVERTVISHLCVQSVPKRHNTILIIITHM